MKLTLTVTVIIFFSVASLCQITTVQSGSWGSSPTWSGGVLPTYLDDVIIGAGHVISVDDSLAVCKTITFGDTSSHLDMNDNSTLSVYGDFIIFSNDHNVFFSGWSSLNAVVKLVGDGNQFLKGFKHLGPSTSFRDLIIDKPSGIVYTDTTAFLTLGIQNRLEIVRGEFILWDQDDIEGRYAMSVNMGAEPQIIIHPAGTFTMRGVTSHIRKNTNNEQIGKMTIYGNATFATTSSNKINIKDINIESGGRLNITTGWSSLRLNPGTITVKPGGMIRNSTTTNVWVDSAVVDLKTGGSYETIASSTVFPPHFINRGTVRYSRNSSASDQTIADMDYYRLEFSFAASNTKKNWMIAANRIIEDSLEINNTAQVILNTTAPSPVTVTVGKTMRLTSGTFNNTNASANLLLADSAEVSRATGQITNTPLFTGNHTVRYTSSVSSVTTGPELPTDGKLLNLIIYSPDQTVTLGNNSLLTGALTLSTGAFDNNGSGDDLNLSLSNGAYIRRALGTLLNPPYCEDKINIEYISTVGHVITGVELPDNPLKINDIYVTGSQGASLDRDLKFSGTLHLIGSRLQTKEYKVILQPGNTLDEQNGVTVYGNVESARNVQANSTENFSNIGFSLTSGQTAPGLTTVVRRTDDSVLTFGVRRQFTVSPETNTGLNATVSYRYTDQEAVNYFEQNLALYSTQNGSEWTKMGGTVDTFNNTITLSGVNSFYTICASDKDNPTGIAGDNTLPQSYEMITAYPNPFNPSTTIRFSLKESGTVKLKIYDSMGSEVGLLYYGYMSAGESKEIRFNAAALGSGTYFAVAESAGRIIVSKISLIK